MFEDPLTVRPEIDFELFGDLCEDPSFPEVRKVLMSPERRHVLWGRPVRWKGAIHVLEARSILGAVKHRSRDAWRHGARITVLNDNLAVVLALQKGRCSNYGLLRIIRRISAHCLVTGIRLSVRWVPSESNVADKPSRWWEPERQSFVVPTGKGESSSWRKATDRGSFHQERGCEVKWSDEEPRTGRCDFPEAGITQSISLDCRGVETSAKCLPEEAAESSSGQEGESPCETTEVCPDTAGHARAEIHPGDEQCKGADEKRRILSLQRLEKFYYDFVRFHLLDISREPELDAALCEYADQQFLNGESCSAGQRLQAALEFVRPEAAREGQLRKALKGWRRMAPTQTRLPMPEFIKSAISGVFLAQDLVEQAIFNETSFSTYGRPGELLKMKAEDFVERNQDFEYSVLVVAPIERAETSKAGIYDEVLILDDKRAPWLERVLRRHVTERKKRKGFDADMWGFNAKQYLQAWRRAVDILGVEDVAKSPYQNRHGGASRDHLMRLRTIQPIQRSDSSARIYAKPGRLQQVLNQHGERLRAFGEEVRQNFGDWCHSGTCRVPSHIRIRIKASKEKPT